MARTLAGLWSGDGLAVGLGHSAMRCTAGFAVSAALGTVLGVVLFRRASLHTAVRPLLSAVQALPAAALVVPVAVICFGDSKPAVYAVVLLGAVPSVAIGVLTALGEVPPALVQAGRAMGAGRGELAVQVLFPAALPGVVAALRQGWTFGWRALMTAELITATPLPGVGRILDAGKQSGDLSLVLAAVMVILAVGVGVESAVFAPLERRVLRRRGLG